MKIYIHVTTVIIFKGDAVSIIIDKAIVFSLIKQH